MARARRALSSVASLVQAEQGLARADMRRRTVLAMGIVSSVGSFALSLAARAQAPAKVYRIGFLIAEALPGQASRVDAVREGLRDLGYVEGRNVVIELRSAEGNYDPLPELSAELIRLKVDVLVPFG